MGHFPGLSGDMKPFAKQKTRIRPTNIDGQARGIDGSNDFHRKVNSIESLSRNIRPKEYTFNTFERPVGLFFRAHPQRCRPTAKARVLHDSLRESKPPQTVASAGAP